MTVEDAGDMVRASRQQNHHHLTPWSAIMEVIVTCFVRSELGA